MALDKNTTLFDRYQIIRRLGQPGGYGTVWLAFDSKLQRQIAIKELHAQFLGDPLTRERVRQEAVALASLKHEHIVVVYEALEHEGGLYILMEYVAGGSLEERLGAGGLPLRQAITFAIQLCDALQAAHERDIIHCDVKPGNLLLDGEDRIKLCDFGTSYVPRSAHGSSLVPRGTPYYAPPELIRGAAAGRKGISPRTDVYSVGATLYRMLTGRHYLAFKSDAGPRFNEDLVLDPQITPEPPSRHNPAVPQRLDRIVLKALEKEPQRRFPSIASLRLALQDALLSQEAPTDPPGPPEKSSRRLWLGLVGAIVLIAGGLALTRPWEPLLGPPAGSVTPTDQPVAAATTVAASTALAHTPSPSPTSTPLPSPTATDRPTVTPSATPTITPSPTLGPGARLTVKGRPARLVSGGAFRMGSDAGRADQAPQHLVWLDPFVIDETEVTVADYRLCLREGPCSAPAAAAGRLAGEAWDEHPMTWISWEEASAYCQWQGGQLPTEAQWEKAARGPDDDSDHLYPWGRQAPAGELANLCDANCAYSFRDASLNDEMAETAPVGRYPAGASPYGVLDMAGNAWEWARDWYAADAYEASSGRNPTGPDQGETRVVRGGGWDSSAETLVVSYRFSLPPDSRLPAVGFRCVYPPPP